MAKTGRINIARLRTRRYGKEGCVWTHGNGHKMSRSFDICCCPPGSMYRGRDTKQLSRQSDSSRSAVRFCHWLPQSGHNRLIMEKLCGRGRGSVLTKNDLATATAGWPIFQQQGSTWSCQWGTIL